MDQEQERWENTWGPNAWHRHWSSSSIQIVEPGRLAKVLMALGARSSFAGLLMVFLIPIGGMAGVGGGLTMVAVGAFIGWALAFGLGNLIPFLRRLSRSGAASVRTAVRRDYDREMRDILEGKHKTRKR